MTFVMDEQEQPRLAQRRASRNPFGHRPRAPKAFVDFYPVGGYVRLISQQTDLSLAIVSMPVVPGVQMLFRLDAASVKIS